MHSDVRFLERLLEAMKAAGLEAIIVGATAASLQGCPILTQDVDLLVPDTRRNREKLRNLATALGAARPMPINDVAGVERITGAAVPIDILFDQIAGGLTFESVRSRSRTIDIGNQRALVAALEDVIVSGEAAVRPKDRAILPLLRDTLRVHQALEECESTKGDSDSDEA